MGSGVVAPLAMPLGSVRRVVDEPRVHPLVAAPGLRLEHLDVPGGPLAALRRDGDGTGAPVLLVAGYTGSKEDFRLLLEPLAAAGHDVVALDQRGQHQSPGPADAGYTTLTLGGNLLAAVDALGLGPVHLVAHSFGGLVARSAVLTDPSAFRSLTLLGSGPAGLTGPRADVLPLLRPLVHEGIPALVAAVDQLNAVDPKWLSLDTATQRFLRDRMLANSPHALLGMADALVAEPDRVDELAAIGLPVLVLHGIDDDAWAPTLQAEMARRLGARHVVVPSAAHSPAVENPAPTLEALLDFFAA